MRVTFHIRLNSGLGESRRLSHLIQRKGLRRSSAILKLLPGALSLKSACEFARSGSGERRLPRRSAAKAGRRTKGKRSELRLGKPDEFPLRSHSAKRTKR